MTQCSARTRRHFITTSFAGIATATLAGCAAGAGLKPLPPPASGPYRLGTGDKLRITVFGQKQLSADYTVGDSGTIDFPLLGPVPARGRSARDLGGNIASSLQRRGILRHPSVTVEVRKYRPFSILGEVNKPGQYRFEPGMTVLTAVSLAGGFTYRAVESDMGVIRVRGRQTHEYRAQADALIEPGDVIKVFERHF
ncbi:polysaccharide export protein [Acidiphilium sp. AL]|uniref:Polysaccharide export protein n=1 Tax=Acidiphilium iwatense TaxID=768198 RepID=A0ABS9E1E4_9PROT|nr:MULTISPECIES: polysaccharide biosynthesis/export family protein [Acidiphilium]MCF3948230.1 polysaccharide export protein [Acidiphilium iwatense]MCU4161334.1 polysaccharide export protein [Acidiphilium sp. AL]